MIDLRDLHEQLIRAIAGGNDEKIAEFAHNIAARLAESAGLTLPKADRLAG